MRSNILHIQDLRDDEKRNLEQHEHHVHAKNQGSSVSPQSCGFVKLNQSSLEDTQRKQYSKYFSTQNTKQPWSSFEFNMSSNTISIKVFKDRRKMSKLNDMKYLIFVEVIEPISEDHNEGVSLCSSKDSSHEWVKLKTIQDNYKHDTESLNDRNIIKNSKGSEFKCVLLLKSPIKKELISWYQAKELCSNFGGSLMKIENDAEQHALQSLILNR